MGSMRTPSNESCYNDFTIQPNISEQLNINICQQELHRAYCFPPNGSRICVPNESVPVYWPSQSYYANREIAIAYQLNSTSFVASQNIGNLRLNLTLDIFNNASQPIAGKSDERALPLYFVSWDKDVGPYFYTVAGPTVTLVRTTQITPTYMPTGTEMGKWPTPSESIEAGDNSRTSLSKGGIASIVVGALFALVAFFTCCIYLSRIKSRTVGRRQTGREGARKHIAAGANVQVEGMAEPGHRWVLQGELGGASAAGRQQDTDDEPPPPYTKRESPKYTP